MAVVVFRVVDVPGALVVVVTADVLAVVVDDVAAAVPGRHW